MLKLLHLEPGHGGKCAEGPNEGDEFKDQAWGARTISIHISLIRGYQDIVDTRHS